MNSYTINSLIELLKRDALKTGEFTLASGRKSHYYIDGRKVTLSSRGAFDIGSLCYSIISKLDNVTAVGGLTMGADPIVGATLVFAAGNRSSNLKGFLVRKGVKDHGTGQLIEGPLESGSNVVIVDDVVTTGGSCFQAIDAVEAIGCKVAAVIVMLDRLEGAAEAFQERNIKFYPLLNIRDLGVEPLGV